MHIQPITLEQIARACGVNKSTVTRALRNEPRISAATRKRIQETAARMGWRENPLVSAYQAHVRARRPVAVRQTLAFITGFSVKETNGLDSVRRLELGIHNRARQLGYSVDKFYVPTPDGPTGRRLDRMFTARGIHGVIIGLFPRPRVLPSLDWSRYASAVIGRGGVAGPELPHSLNDQWRIMTLCLTEVAARGYRRPGLVMHEAEEQRVDWQWLGAYLSLWDRLHPGQGVTPYEKFSGDEPALWEWFRQQQPDVILSHLPQVLELFRAHGVRVPGECGFILLERSDDLRDVAGVRHDFEQVGANAVDLVDGQLRRNERGVPAKPKIVLAEGTWVEGSTVRPRLAVPEVTGAVQPPV